MSGIAARLERLRADVDAELLACGREPGSVTIVGVSKKQPVESMLAALDAGLTDLGENYVQEAQHKFEAVAQALGRRPVAHFIGHVQTNKAKAIVRTFDVVQSVDSAAVARALGRATAYAGKPLRVLLQVNISPSERFGCPPQEAEALAGVIREEPLLELEGVMAIGPLAGPGDRPRALEKAFALAAMTLSRVGGSTLSIGMSGDWREAVRAGSTMIRIGAAIFGDRRYE